MGYEKQRQPRVGLGAPTTLPRVGIPFRTTAEEVPEKSHKLRDYLRAVRDAGGEPLVISLGTPRADLQTLARSLGATVIPARVDEFETLDALVLPGSPADVDPGRYGAEPHIASNSSDRMREGTDSALLEHAFGKRKPVLAICYGMQSLNVHLGGTLIQDIPSEVGTEIKHDRKGLKADERDPCHPIRIETGCRLGDLAGATEVRVNSSHHQAIRESGRGLRVVAHAPDSVVEAVEWTGDANWVVGVQWHPERMAGEALAAALFRELIAAARGAARRSGPAGYPRQP